jgi:hypothetical protein
MLVCRTRCVMENLNGDCSIRVKLLASAKMIGKVKILVSFWEAVLITFRHERGKR